MEMQELIKELESRGHTIEKCTQPSVGAVNSFLLACAQRYFIGRLRTEKSTRIILS